MFKRLLYGIVAMTALFHSSARGQTRVHTTPDSLINKKLITCGVSASYFKSLARTSYSGSSTAIILPSSFPTSAIDTCGKFRVFYADRAISSGKGFDETIGGKGINRRAVVCNVLSYVQSVLDFSKIPSGQYIRLYVDTSYSSTHPAPILTKFYAAAGARFLSTTTGVVDGDVHDYIISGSDPSTTGDYHAELIVNFDKTYLDSFTTKPIVYNDSLGAVGYCAQDLFSTILHEITHTLGWSSLMPVLLDSVSTASFSQYTSIDTSLHTHSFGTPFSSLSPAFSGGKVTVATFRQHFWINGKNTPHNHPVFNYSEDYTPAWTLARSFAHLDDDLGVYAYRARNSPGDFQNYVMSPFGHEGEMRRSYTKGELETLHNILGYTYHSSISGTAVATNKTAWSSKMSSVAYNAAFTNEIEHAFHETIKADTIITNDSGTVWVYRLNADTTLKDADGDSLSVYPNSLVNFRGAGNGGNNHNQISISPDGKTITYTPRHNFYGRCQFGYNLFDGHEKGGFVLMTIDVKKGNNVNAKAGENLVLNGDFEEGSEVKIRNIAEDVNNTALISRKVGRLHGGYFSDSHPYDYWSNAWTPYGGGTAIRNTLSDCDSLGVLKSGFGSPTSSFPLPAAKYYFPFAPTPPSNLGNRYQNIFKTGYYYLADSLRSCHNYIFETDVYMPIAGMKFDMRTLFTDTGKLYWSKIVYDSMYTKTKKYNHKITPDISETFSTSGWQHIKIPFSYCSSTPSDLLVLELDGFIIDNLSIKEDTTKMTVKIFDSAYLPCSDTRLWAKLTNVSKYTCLAVGSGLPLKYTWTANGDTINVKDSIIYVTPLVLTKYKIAVFDGCRTTLDSITLAPKVGFTAYIADTFMCKNDSITLSPIVTGTVGTVTYSWSPSTGLSCSTCANPKASPSVTTKYTLTITDSVSCFKRDVTLTVLPIPVISVNDTSICASSTTILRVSGGSLSDTYFWLDPSVTCTTCSTTSTPTLTVSKDFVVKVTNTYGCSVYDTASVTILPLPTITTIPVDTIMCSGDSISLSASGGLTYRWLPPTGLSCLTCSTPKASPTAPGLSYEVTGTNSYGCINRASISIKVLKSPSLVALPSDTAICGSGYITLRASGAGTYLWTPSAGVSSPTSAITTAFVSASTTYVVKGTDSGGCYKTDTVNVTVKPKPTVTVTTPFVNLCTGDSVSLNASGASSYLWTSSVTPSGLACPTCPITKGKPATFPVTYTVTGTDTNGCSNTATVTADVVVCACTPSSVFGTSATTLTTATLPATLSAGYYYLPNDLTINANTIMTGAKILIERGVTISVANNAKLTLDGCHLFTCDEDTAKGMWRGIVLASGATTSGRIEVKNNSLIEDALFAIDALTLRTPISGDVINVTNSTFNRNQVDISMNDYKVSSPAILPITIKGNLFTARKFSRTTMAGYPNTWTSTNTLKATTTVTDSKPSYTISKTAALTKAKCKDSSIFSFVGIRTNNMGQTSATGVYQSEVKIGEGAALDDYNLFDNHQYGLTSFNCNISLFHNHFINISRRMIPDPSTTATIGNGMAVILLAPPTANTRAQVLPSTIGGNLLNKFHDCFTAIYTEDVTTLNIQNSIITTSNTAGATVAGAAYPSETFAGYGIMVHGDGIQKSNTITGNTISNVNVGFQMSTVNPKTGVTTNISNNFLYAANPDILSSYTGKQYMTKAIDIYGTGGVWSTDNTMTINNNLLSKVFNGISFQGLTNTKCSTTNNTITMWDTITTVSGSMQYGIQANYTNEATISGNTVSNISSTLSADRVRGVIAANNSVLRICGNTTNNIGRGFEFAKGAAQTGTRWIGNTMNNGYKGMVLASDIGEQGFTYNYASMIPPTFYGATLNKWNSFSGSSYQTFVEGTTMSSLSKLNVKNIPTGVVELPSANWGSPPTFRYIYPTTLITKQQESNCLGATYPIKFNPIPKPIGGIGKTLGSYLMADSLGYDSTYHVRQWMSQLSLYELGTIDPVLRDSSAALDSFMNEAAGSRFAWLTQIEAAINQDSLATAQNLLDNPVVAMGRVVVNGDLIITDYEAADNVVSNYTDYYSAYIHYLQSSMDETDSLRIQWIANKCPVIDGAVVYKARTLQQILSRQNVVYNDDSCEYSNGQYRLVQNGSISGSSNEYSLYPNPNNGIFTIKQSIVEDKIVSIRLYNALGQQFVQEKVQFKNGMANFKVQNASAGLYLICLSDEQNKTVCLKFTIQ